MSNTSSRASFTIKRLKRFGFDPDMFIGGITSGEEALKHIKTQVSENWQRFAHFMPKN